jgi:hypothetical protein
MIMKLARLWTFNDHDDVYVRRSLSGVTGRFQWDAGHSPAEALGLISTNKMLSMPVIAQLGL